MSDATIINRKTEITTLITNRNLEKAFELLKQYAEELKQPLIGDQIKEKENSYLLLIKYLIDGYQDPQRIAIYNDIVSNLFQFAETLCNIELEQSSTAFIYSKRRYAATHPTIPLKQLTHELEELFAQIQLQSLLDESEEKKTLYLQSLKRKEELQNDIFIYLLICSSLNEEERLLILNLFEPHALPSESTGLWVSALMLSTMSCYHESKLILLLDIWGIANKSVATRALTAFIITAFVHADKLALSLKLSLRIESIADDVQARNDVRTIVLQLISSKGTEKVSRKITEEIFSQISKLSSHLKEKIFDNTPDQVDGAPLDINPKWQEMLEESGIDKKLQELSEMQMDGEDVFMSTFSNLKSFPFFDQLSNWFIPFTTDNIAALETGNYMGKSNFAQIIARSNFLCNSDKFSFCLSLSQIPAEQRERMVSQFEMEGDAMQELEKDDSWQMNKGNTDIISNRYIQDIYRFYKLSPRKTEFQDPFDLDFNPFNVEALLPIFDDEHSRRLLAEFFFKKEHFAEALSLFESIGKDEHAYAEIYQKIGFCLTRLQRYEEALEAYLKAEMILPEDLWTIKQIAACYRKLEKSRKALDYYLRAEKITPDTVSLLLNIGHCYLEIEEYDEALRYYFKAHYLSPENIKIWRPIAWCSFVTDKMQQADKFYSKIIEAKASSSDFLNAAHTAWAMGNPAQAILYYKSSLTIFEGSFDEFIQNLTEDLPFLVKAGINKAEFPIVIDALRFQHKEMVNEKL